MADVAAPEGETANQRQARLRREKRQKKMAEEGEDRLAKIKALNGGVAPPEEALSGPNTSAPKAATVEDPDEADIDSIQGIHTPQRQARAAPQDNPLAAAMFQMQQGQQGGQGAGEDDPMVRMMQQLTGMMGGNAQNPGDPNQPPQIPAALSALMGGGGQQATAPVNSSAYLWRIVHAVFAFTLAIYITVTGTFNGTKLARAQSVYSDASSYGLGPRLFIIFTSAELVLQSSRFFLEKGQLQGSGMLATVANSGLVPEPYAQYIKHAGRYIGIAQTIFKDAMVIVFVFGVLAWWRGMAVA
ncbi:hypothetical protein LTR62_007917 [Meristemomyces frigidus]|uniref:Golgi to ER traffic protein 2 n=1 Tax=Meristemomyces frigidus TaxID=1508187 RepID=A0AAN7TPB8_9PEZI|nr:hypothetical protein LTR62_007917 [Meristemomyces frigidus]